MLNYDSMCNMIHFPLSVNQLLFYIANIPDTTRSSATKAESVFNSKIDEAVP